MDDLLRSLLSSVPGQVGITLLIIMGIARWAAPMLGKWFQVGIERSTQQQVIQQKKQEVELSAESQRLEAELAAQKRNIDLIERVFGFLQGQMEKMTAINAQHSETQAQILAELTILRQTVDGLSQTVGRQQLAITAVIERMPGVSDVVSGLQAMSTDVTQTKRDINHAWARVRDIAAALEANSIHVTADAMHRVTPPE